MVATASNAACGRGWRRTVGRKRARRPASRDSVIILTGGLSGSSALAGLLSAAGYWSGEDTFRKRDYNTYENAELIRLNRQLMQRVAVGEDTRGVLRQEAIDDIRGAGRARARCRVSRAGGRMRFARAVALEGSAAVAD